MVIWRLQSSRYSLVNSKGAKLTGGRWNRAGTPVIYASESIALAALEIIAHHGGIPEDYVTIRIEVPEDVEIGTVEIPTGWPDKVPERLTAMKGTIWVNAGKQAVLRVPSATMSGSGYNYILNPAHPEFSKLTFSFESIRFDHRLRSSSGGT